MYIFSRRIRVRHVANHRSVQRLAIRQTPDAGIMWRGGPDLPHVVRNTLVCGYRVRIDDLQGAIRIGFGILDAGCLQLVRERHVQRVLARRRLDESLHHGKRLLHDEIRRDRPLLHPMPVAFERSVKRFPDTCEPGQVDLRFVCIRHGLLRVQKIGDVDGRS